MEKTIYTREYEVLIDLLRQLRIDAGVTQVELADRIGENQVYVSRYEGRQIRLDVVQVRTICEALGGRLVDLMVEFERRV